MEVVYPPGLEEMIGAFKFCATARLFLQVGTLHVFLRDLSWIIFRLMLTQKKVFKKLKLLTLENLIIGRKRYKCPNLF